jgi:HEAT repeat protein
LLTALLTGDFEARWRVVQQLGSEFHPDYLAVLRDACQASPLDWELHWCVARLCSFWRGPEVLATLLDLWSVASEPDVQTLVLQAIAQQGEAGFPFLRQMLGQPSSRGIAIRAIARSERPPALTLLLEWAQTAPESLQAEVLMAVGALRDERVLQLLRQSLQAPEASVRQAAILGLRQQPDCAPFERLQLVQPLLYDPDPVVAREAIWAIAHLDTPSAAEVLAQRLPHLLPQAQQGVIQALATLESPVALRALATLLKPESDAVLARVAIRALGNCPQVEAATSLLLSRLGKVADELADLAYSLGQLGQPGAIAPLQACLSQATAAQAVHLESALRRLRASVRTDI